MIRTDLGPVTAYAIAVAHGYTGTEEEFAQFQANSAANAQAASASAQDAAASASEAAQHASNAEDAADRAANMIDDSLSVFGMSADSGRTGDSLAYLADGKTDNVYGDETSSAVIALIPGKKWNRNNGKQETDVTRAVSSAIARKASMKTLSVSSGYNLYVFGNDLGPDYPLSGVTSSWQTSYDISNVTYKYVYVSVKKTDDSDITSDDLTSVLTLTSRAVLPYALEEDLNEVIEEKGGKNLFDASTVEIGKVLNINNGQTAIASTHGVSDYIKVGSTFVISGDRDIGNAGLRICFYTAALEFIPNSGKQYTSSDSSYNSTLHRYYIAINSPAGTKFIRFSSSSFTGQYVFNWMVENGTTPTEYVAYVTLRKFIKMEALPEELTEEVESLRSDVDEIKDYIGTGLGTVEMIAYTATSGYMAKTGDVSAGAGYGYTNKIAVVPGDVIKGVTKVNSKSSVLRFVCAFSGSTAVPEKGADSVYKYTVPDGIDSVVITGLAATSGDATSIPNFFRFTNGTAPKKGNTSAFTVKGNLADGQYFALPITNIAKDKVVTFDALITSFTAIKYGRSYGDYGVRITSDSIELVDASGTVISTSPHGLTIANTLSVRLVQSVDTPNTLRVYLSSNGANANVVTVNWTRDQSGFPHMLSEGSTLTDCTFSFAPVDINKKIALFGDSYMSFGNNRWVGQLKNCGYIGNVLLNQYSGESAAQAVPALLNIIDKANFRFLVWGIGMNDGTDGSSYSTTWKNAIDVVVTACVSRGIVPILCTIPSIPSSNNEKKNEWIRSSGYRYIDFAKSVGAQANGTWFAGMLSNDNTHPSEMGAIALCNRALSDCPELMQIS